MEPDALFARLAAARAARHEALALVVRLRATLNELEADLVTSARRSGETWSDIARTLGVTPQAAQQRLSRRVRR